MSQRTWVALIPFAIVVVAAIVGGFIFFHNRNKSKQWSIPASGETWTVSRFRSPDGNFCNKNPSRLTAVDLMVTSGQDGCKGLSLKSLDGRYDYSSSCIVPDPKDPHQFSLIPSSPSRGSSPSPASAKETVALSGKCRMDSGTDSFTCQDENGIPNIRGWAAKGKPPSDVETCQSQVSSLKDGQAWRIAKAGKTGSKESKPKFCGYPGEMRVSSDKGDTSCPTGTDFKGTFEVQVDVAKEACSLCLASSGQDPPPHVWCLEDNNRCVGVTKAGTTDTSCDTNTPVDKNCVMRSGFTRGRRCKYTVEGGTEVSCAGAPPFSGASPGPFTTSSVCIKNTTDGFDMSDLGSCTQYGNSTRFICKKDGEVSAVGWTKDVDGPDSVTVTKELSEFDACMTGR